MSLNGSFPWINWQQNKNRHENLDVYVNLLSNGRKALKTINKVTTTIFSSAIDLQNLRTIQYQIYDINNNFITEGCYKTFCNGA